MVEQLKEDAIGLFEALHPNCVAVFLFDNSSNHGAFADDALVASRMTLNEKPWPLSEKFQFRDTSVLEEVIINSVHVFELYHKYHCECNWIEMYWGVAKREARDYSFKSLEENIDSFLDKAGDLAHIRRYFRRSMDFIEAYSRCTDGREVVQEVKKFVEKKYLSHRKVRVPSDLV
ncbi:hypothetical protein G6F50_006604 [Rhizopus delemar]|uniref:Uncharacterized protein n=1 Tax=Rhizopus delemar TaxID=936053 RepID=A0A9P6Z247_9FUNG|nr:hypothetical protein G6F50_006604 [Rhizopus delemar]